MERYKIISLSHFLLRIIFKDTLAEDQLTLTPSPWHVFHNYRVVPSKELKHRCLMHVVNFGALGAKVIELIGGRNTFPLADQINEREEKLGFYYSA